jgi:hypothetical protein
VQISGTGSVSLCPGTRREVFHIGLWEVGGRGEEMSRRGASQEMPHRGTRRGKSRIAAREEVVARIAGHQDPTRSRDQQGVARRSRPPEPDNLAHKMREPQLFPQIRR